MTKGMRRGLAALVLVPALYALLGFLLLPWAALALVNQQLARQASVPAQLQRIEFNPFSLELTLHDLRFGTADAGPLAFTRLYADLQLDSLWRGALHLRELRLDGAQVELLFAADGTLNLSRLLGPATETASPGPADAEPFPLQVDRLAIDAARLYLRDERPETPVELRYDSLDLQVQDLHTRSSLPGRLELRASGAQGSTITLHGQLGLQPLQASGQLDVEAIDLPGWWPYVRRLLAVELPQGRASLSAGFQLDLQDGLRLQLDDSRLQLDDLQLQLPGDEPLLALEHLELGAARLALAPGGALQLAGGRAALRGLEWQRRGERPLLALAGLEAADIDLTLAERQLTIGRLHSRGLQAHAARLADGHFDWQVVLAGQLARLQPPSAAPHGTARVPARATDPASPADGAGPSVAAHGPWRVNLASLQLRDWRVRLVDRQAQPVTTLELGPLRLDAGPLGWPATQPLRLELDSALGAHGRLRANGQLHLQPLAAHMQVQAEALDLRLAQAYLAPFIRLELRSGSLDADLAVALQGADPLALRISGQAGIRQLHALDTLKGRDFVRWQALQLDGLDYRHGEQLAIGAIRLQQPYARFIVNEDLSTNIQELLIPQPPGPASGASGTPLHLAIGGIDIRDGSANFADFSLTPDFATALQQLDGHIGRLDNRSPQPATVEIRGKVDRYAPVTIQGHLTAFAPLQQLDIATRFRRVELTTLTPYAGKFAGYKIRKGRLNLDLHYRIREGRLNAENRVLLEDLQLGERVDSPSATDLPVRLAVALLKDTDGNIDIALPIQGDLNNPEFSVAPLLLQTLRNLLLRAVQAPFGLIAGLVEGDAGQLDSVPFAPGSSTLDENARHNLARLATALQQRPGLRLEIEGMSLAALDGPPLAEQRLQRELRETWYRLLQRRGDRLPADPGLLEVPEDMQGALLEGIYRARLGQQPPAAWRVLDAPARHAQLRRAVLDSWAQSPLLLRRLAQERARTIKAWLTEAGGLSDARLYLLEVGSATAADTDGLIAVPLHLDSE